MSDKPISPVRQCMIEDITVRNFGEKPVGVTSRRRGGVRPNRRAARAVSGRGIRRSFRGSQAPNGVFKGMQVSRQ